MYYYIKGRFIVQKGNVCRKFQVFIFPIYFKIIEKIIKSRENPKILEVQNTLQKGFTEDTSPLLCELSKITLTSSFTLSKNSKS
jgi:hypothetical protein